MTKKLRHFAVWLLLFFLIVAGVWLWLSSGRVSPLDAASSTSPASATGLEREVSGKSGPPGSASRSDAQAGIPHEGPSSVRRNLATRRGPDSIPTARFREVTVFGSVSVDGKAGRSIRVRFLRSPAPRDSKAPVSAATGSTGTYSVKLRAPGVYRVSLLPAESEISLLETRLPLDGLQDRVERNFSFGSLAKLRLLVVRPDGGAANNHPVTFSRRGVTGWSLSHASTGSDGIVDLSLKAGDYVVSSWNPDDGWFGTLTVTLPPKELVSATLRLRRPLRQLRGTVLDSETGSGIAEARLTLLKSTQIHPDPALPSLAITTDTEGRFAVPATEEGEYYLSAKANGYLDGRSESISVSAGEPLPELTIGLQRGFDLAGLVLDSDGVAAPGAEVRLRFSAAGGALTEISTVGDELGEFLFEGVARGSAMVFASLDGNSSQPMEVTLPETDLVTLRLRALEGRIEGRVVWSDGEPITQPFRVTLIRQTQPFSISNLRPFQGPLQDLHGQFVLEGIDPGSYVVQVTAAVPDTTSSEKRSGQSTVFEMPEQGGTIQIEVAIAR